MGGTMRYTAAGRVAAGALAAAGWFGVVRYLLGENEAQGGNWLAALWTNLGFLTDLTNLGLAIVMTGIALGVPRLSAPRVVGWAVAAIMTVGIGFWVIGGRLIIGTSALEDIVLHAVTPWAALLFWMACAPKGGLSWRLTLPWLAWPALYWSYALSRGALTGAYAYPFLEVGKRGGAAVATMIAVLVAIYIACGLAVIGLDKLKRGTARR